MEVILTKNSYQGGLSPGARGAKGHIPFLLELQLKEKSNSNALAERQKRKLGRDWGSLDTDQIFSY